MNEYLEKLKRHRSALEKAIAEEEAKQPSVGSLDWAIQRMREGEKIFRPDWEDETARISMVDENTVRWESGISETYIWNLDDWARPMSDKYKASGWQIYKEPEQQKPKPETLFDTWQCPVCGESISAEFEDSGHPRYNEEHLDENLCFAIGDHMKYSHTVEQPKYKVGDWVEVYGKQHLIIGRPYIEDNDWLMNDVYGNQEKYHEIDITRKLAPSEVVIRIGCLSGRIEALTCNCCKDKVFVLLLETGGFIEIPFSALDKPTSKLVKKLLKAQEDK